MKRNLLLTTLLTTSISFCAVANSTDSVKLGVLPSGQSTGQPIAPKKEYKELPNPKKAPEGVWNSVLGNVIGWGSIDTRYKKELPSGVSDKSISLTAWRGEQVAAQIAVSSKLGVGDLNIEVSPLVNNRNKSLSIATKNISASWIRYVMTDQLNHDPSNNCGYRPDATKFDSSLVADPIDHVTKSINLSKETTNGAWVSVTVPRDIAAGIYRGNVSVKSGDKVIATLRLSVTVLNRTLPKPSEWAFHLDLWQNPYAVARYYDVEPWSDEHLTAMRPLMEIYARAGGKVLTTTIINRPWNGQTYDAFSSMVRWTKTLNGKWVFNFDIFDRWVDFGASCGVDKQISCYSIIPWRLAYRYYDEASDSFKELKSAPGTEEFDEAWGAMLSRFALHLKKRGLFEKTTISIDERPMDVILKTAKIIKKADKNFKMTLAGNWHNELDSFICDYSIPIDHSYPAGVIERRRGEGKTTTYYTCCTEARPNTYTFSEPAEGAWIPLHSAYKGLDGYLRWAFNSWTAEPLLDSRFTAWAGGDTYMVYPEGRSSIRIEQIMRGVQDFEKVRILREELKGNKKALDAIDAALQMFDKKNLNDGKPAADAVNNLESVINSL